MTKKFSEVFNPSTFASPGFIVDVALERLAEAMGSMVEFLDEMAEIEPEQITVTENVAPGFIVEIGKYSVWVEHWKESGWIGTTVLNRDEYGIEQEVAG